MALPSFQARLHGLPTRAPFTAFFRATEHIRLTEEVTGYFRGGNFYLAVAEAHRTMAKEVQDRAVEILQQRVAETGRPQLEDVPRPGREANRLRTSILAEDNRFVSATGFTVGREQWLRRSPAALYYRIIEEGGQSYQTSGFFFTHIGGKAQLPGSARDAIKLSQRKHLPFGFTVSATPAYNMMRDAGVEFMDDRHHIYDIYQRRLEMEGMPIPLKRTS